MISVFDKNARPVVLLVDDDDGFRQVFSEGLRMRGFEIIQAGSAEDAESILDRTAGPIDALVTDLNLGDGWGGRLAFSSQTRRPELAVVFISGYTPGDEVLRHGIQDHMHFLGKPFSISELAEAVRSAIRSARGSEDTHAEQDG